MADDNDAYDECALIIQSVAFVTDLRLIGALVLHCMICTVGLVIQCGDVITRSAFQCYPNVSLYLTSYYVGRNYTDVNYNTTLRIVGQSEIKIDHSSCLEFTDDYCILEENDRVIMGSRTVFCSRNYESLLRYHCFKYLFWYACAVSESKQYFHSSLYYDSVRVYYMFSG